MYYGEFNCWEDVSSQFSINETDQDKVVLFAAYDVPNYEGYAMVIYIQNGKFYIVEGSHCSCYGLENEWTPDEMPLEALLRMADSGLGMLNKYNLEFKKSIRFIQELDLKNINPSDIQLVLKLALG